jgi:hypothetical protein
MGNAQMLSEQFTQVNLGHSEMIRAHWESIKAKKETGEITASEARKLVRDLRETCGHWHADKNECPDCGYIFIHH